MLKLNPNILSKNGKKEFVVLSYDEFTYMQEELETYNDLRDLRKAKAKENFKPSIALSKVKNMFK